MNGRPLPGLWWDEQRQRYFPLRPGQNRNPLTGPPLPSSISAPASSGKRRKLSSVQSPRFDASNDPRRISRSKLGHGLFEGGSSLMRELDLDPSPVSRSRTIKCRSIGLIEDDKLCQLTDVRPLGPFAWDSATNAMIMCSIDHGDQNERTELKSLLFDTREVTNDKISVQSSHHLPEGNLRRFFNSRITSISLSASRVLAVTTLGGSYPPTLNFLHLLDPSGGHSSPAADLDIIYTRGNAQTRSDASYWSSAPSPHAGPTQARIAVGSDDGVYIYATGLDGTGWSVSGGLNLTDHEKPDAARALEWLNPHTLAVGQDSGKIILWDTRSDQGLASKALRLNHPLNVYGLKCADISGHKLLATGPAWATCMYDLRMPRSSTGHGWADLPEVIPSHASRLRNRTKTWTTPTVRYDNHDSAMHGSGWAASVDNGLLVLGNKNDKLAIYDLHRGGKALKESCCGNDTADKQLGVSPRMSNGWSAVQGCEFVDVEGRDGLLYNWKHQIRRCCW